MKRVIVTLIGLMFSSLIGAQDFIQQWRDSAIKGMNEFRAAHWAEIEAQGWQFVQAAVSSEGIPSSDFFIKGVKIQDGPIRSASVLNVSYVPLLASDLPEYQSTKALVWFNCNAGQYEHRSVERYLSVDGRGDPTSSDAEKPSSAPAQMQDAEPQSIEKTLLMAACSAKL